MTEKAENRLLNEDARRLLHFVQENSVDVTITSPPYYGVTNYHYDQWLRLWLLGGRPNATRVSGKHRGKFEDRKKYRTLLRTVFRRASKLMSPDACVYVRTDRRKSTYAVTRAVLREVFPTKRLRRHLRPVYSRALLGLIGTLSSKGRSGAFPKQMGCLLYALQ